MQHTDVGALGEAMVARKLVELGHRVERGVFADLRAGGVEIEVKTSRPSEFDGRFQFCVHRDGRDGIEGALMVLVCLVDDGRVVYYIIPALLALGLGGRCCGEIGVRFCAAGGADARGAKNVLLRQDSFGTGEGVGIGEAG